MDKIENKWRVYLRIALLHGGGELLLSRAVTLYTPNAEISGEPISELVKDLANEKLEELKVPITESIQSYILAFRYVYEGEVKSVDIDENVDEDKAHEEIDKKVWDEIDKAELSGATPGKVKHMMDGWFNKDIRPVPEFKLNNEKEMVRHCIVAAARSLEIVDNLYDIYANFLMKHKPEEVTDIIDTMIQMKNLTNLLTTDTERKLKTDEMQEISKTMHNIMYHAWKRTNKKLAPVLDSVRYLPDHIDDMCECTVADLLNKPKSI